MAAVTVRPMRQIMDGVAAWMAEQGDGSVHKFGAEYLPEQIDAGSRYVWCPTADTPVGPYEGIMLVGPYPGTARAITTFSEGVAVHVWGVVAPPDDAQDPDVYRDAAYWMRNNLIVGLRAKLAANCVFGASGWYKPTSQSLAMYGRVYVLNFHVDIAAPDVVLPLARIKQIVMSSYGTDPADPTSEQFDQTITLST